MPNDSPTITPPTSPGPAVAAIPAISAKVTPASASARAVTGSISSTCARAAISGTTPPNGACCATWLATTDERTTARPPASSPTTAAAVSSQLVSRPSTRNGGRMEVAVVMAPV